jgi:hypothetical protein
MTTLWVGRLLGHCRKINVCPSDRTSTKRYFCPSTTIGSPTDGVNFIFGAARAICSYYDHGGSAPASRTPPGGYLPPPRPSALRRFPRRGWSRSPKAQEGSEGPTERPVSALGGPPATVAGRRPGHARHGPGPPRSPSCYACPLLREVQRSPCNSLPAVMAFCPLNCTGSSLPINSLRAAHCVFRLLRRSE